MRASRLLVPVAVVVAAGAVAAVGRVGGRPVIGFRYVVTVDNAAAEAPNRIVAVADDRLTLDDGRVLRVEKGRAAEVATLAKPSGDRVGFDAATGRVTVLARAAACVLDHPESEQWLTVPLLKVPIKKYTVDPVAVASVVRR